MIDYLPVAEMEGVPRGGGCVVRANGREIALFNVDGEICALENQCPHRGASLGDGTVEGHTVFCPLHGWQFDLKTGACLDKPDRPAASLPVRVVDGRIEVAL